MALILVVVIAALLAALALPFAFSMGQQEKGVRRVTDHVHACYATAAARNRAVAANVAGWEGLEERRGAAAPFNTPWADLPAEFSAGRAGRPPATGLETGALVADEQGKINVRTAPAMCVANLMKRIDPRVDDTRDYLTEANGRPAAWIAPQTVRWMEIDAGRHDRLCWIRIDDPSHFGPGARIRVTGKRKSSVGEFLDWDPIRIAYRLKDLEEAVEEGALLEVEQRHPVNINTASREVLAACLEGLVLRDFIGKEVVTRQEADALAAAMVKATFLDWDDFWKFLSKQAGQGAISDLDAAAITANVSGPTDWKLAGTGTMPFTLRSLNFVTVAARGVVDRANRSVGGECDLREIVELAPPGTLHWRCKSQQDFNEVIGRGMSRGFFSYPMYPWEKPERDRNRSSWFTGATAPDERNHWGLEEHFGPANEGKDVGDGMTYAGVPAFSKGQVVCWPSGAAELWMQGPETDATIYEAGDEEWSNRVLLTYEGIGSASGPYLRLVVKDATLEKGFSQVVARVELRPGRWYHVGAFWKSTRNGGMMLTLDGLPVGDWRAVGEGPAQDPGLRLGTAVHLAADVRKDALAIDCDADVGHFPSPGAIAIGQEVIEYRTAIGRSFNDVTRGARGSPALDHRAGETIAPWGYTDCVVETSLDYTAAGLSGPVLKWDRIPDCAGALRHAVGSFAHTTTMIWGKDPTNPKEVGFGKGELVLSVPKGTAAGFPDQGWLLIGNSDHEIVHYTGHDDSRFTGLTRGDFGTPDRDHYVLEPVALDGFYVDTNEGFPDPAVLCIGNEFVGPVQKVGNDGWIAYIGTLGKRPAPWSLFRSYFWGPSSTDADYPAGKAVLPTFALEDRKAGRGDRVTLLQQDYEKREEAWIACSAWLEGGKSPIEPSVLFSVLTKTEWPFLLAGLDRQAMHEVVADRPFDASLPSSHGRFNLRRYSRVIRFPSGELPCSPPAPFRIGVSAQDSAPEELAGWVDELRSFTAEYGRVSLGRAIDAAKTDLTLGVAQPAAPASEPPVSWTPLDALGGAILVDDELIGYETYDPVKGRLEGVKRGYLGTTPRPHAAGSAAFPLTALAIGVLQRPASPEDRMLEAQGTSGFPQEGYFLVDGELAGWTRVTDRTIGTPSGCAFRGAFGTQAATHDAGALLYAMPWRFYDRYTRASDDSDLHWFEATLRATGARWKSLRWEEMFAGASVRIRVFVRFNGGPRWIELPAPPGSAVKGRLPRFYEFDSHKGGRLGDTVADQLDVRIMYEVLDGAYARGEWKESPEFRGFDVEYEQENVVHRHEEK